MTKCGFLGGKEAIVSLRSSGYKDTSMAIGELIDNSIQANANEITIILRTENGKITTRSTTHITDIIVVDNGKGMPPDVLQQSLRLGEGLNRNEPRGMGKYGVGLPQSSISQAKRIDVWSWTDSKPPMHVFIDLDDDEWLNDAEIKEPDAKPLPNDILPFISKEHGTIVMWSDTDRISWKKASTVFNKCENRVGRMYRHWLNNGSVKLRMLSIDRNGRILEGQDNYFRAVDPLFLMENAKYEDSPIIPMFEPYREPYTKSYDIIVDGLPKKAKVELRFSISKPTIRISEDDEKFVAGRTKYGKLAKECTGVSIVRENRELELCDSWYMPAQKDPRHRWWGAEIRFDSDLDEIFGVTNNKQSANRLTELARKTDDELLEEFGISSSDRDYDEKRLKDEMPNQYVLYDVITSVSSAISKMDSQINSQLKKARSQKASRYDSENKTKDLYDTVAEERSKNDDTRSETDKLIVERGENRLIGVDDSISQNEDYSDLDREKIRDDVILGHRCSIVVSKSDSSSFFNIATEDTQMVVKLNSSHAMYDQLFGKFDSILTGSGDAETIKIQVKDAFDTVQYLLASWARMEDESRTPELRKQYRQTRERWGTILEESYANNQ